MPENSLKLTSTNYSIRFIVALGTSTCSVTEGFFTLRKGKVSYDTELGSVEQETLPLSALTGVRKRVEFRENVWAVSSRDKKMSLITRYP